MQFEEKGVQPFSLPVLSNFVVTSNDDGVVKIADGERRWVLHLNATRTTTATSRTSVTALTSHVARSFSRLSISTRHEGSSTCKKGPHPNS